MARPLRNQRSAVGSRDHARRNRGTISGFDFIELRRGKGVSAELFKHAPKDLGWTPRCIV